MDQRKRYDALKLLFYFNFKFKEKMHSVACLLPNDTTADFPGGVPEFVPVNDK